MNLNIMYKSEFMGICVCVCVKILKVKNSGKVIWIRVPVSIVSVTQKLSTIKGHQDQNCLFREIIERKVMTPKIVIGLSPGEDSYVDRLPSRMEEQCQHCNCLF